MQRASPHEIHPKPGRQTLPKPALLKSDQIHHYLPVPDDTFHCGFYVTKWSHKSFAASRLRGWPATSGRRGEPRATQPFIPRLAPAQSQGGRGARRRRRLAGGLPRRPEVAGHPRGGKCRVSFVQLLSVGHSTITPGMSYPPVQHPSLYHFNWQNGRVLPEFSLMLITAGEGLFDSEATGKIALRSGMAALLFPGLYQFARLTRRYELRVPGCGL